jgi:hypothetical protein
MHRQRHRYLRHAPALAGCLLVLACVAEPVGEESDAIRPAVLLAGAGSGVAVRDTSAVSVTYGASGGTITPRGLYTAGSQAGTFRVVASVRGVADTATVTLVAPPSPLRPAPPAPPSATTASGTPAPPAVRTASGVGIPMGMAGLMTAGAETGPFGMSMDGYNADNIIPRLESARRRKLRILMNLTGGNHKNYMTDGAFDMNKWMAKMQTFNTSSIEAAIAAGVADGTIIGSSVMDEPHNESAQASWGPRGTMTKAGVDDMCRYVKTIFPMLPVGVVHDHRVFEPDQGYSSCDFIVSQYTYRKTKGDVEAFRDGGLAFAARNHMSIIFSLNVLDGGIPRKASGTCEAPETGGPGTYGRNCRMTAQQIRDFGLTLGPAGCAFTMWRFDREFFDDSANKASFEEIADSLAKVPAKACRRQ